MKWYHSVKVKLLGFFLIISAVFLISMVVVFFFLKEKNIGKNASDATNLATSFIIQKVKVSQAKAETVVSVLAASSVTEFNNTTKNDSVVVSILGTDKSRSINIVSGGVWFEPYAVKKELKDFMIFYNRDSKGQFVLVHDYLNISSENYRSMPFYTLAKTLKPSTVAWTDVYVDPVTKVSMITAVAPIYREQTFVGVASVDIKVTQRDEVFWEHFESSDFYMMIVDKNGNFIAKSHNIKTYASANNIYAVKNRKFQKIVKKIKPVLKHSIEHSHILKNELLNKIFFIEEDPVFHDESVISVYRYQNTGWSLIVGMLKEQVMAQSDQTFKTILFLVIILTLLVTIIGYFVLQKIFVSPIESINDQLKKTLADIDPSPQLLLCEDKGEIGNLVDNLNTRTLSLTETQRREADEKAKRMKNEKILLQQSKMAAMGEMMDAVAHQWKQPLNALSMYSEIIKSDYDDGSVDKAYVAQFRDDLQVQIDHMVNTLDEFRTFFRPNTENQVFSLLSIVHSVLFLTKDDLLKNRINVRIEQKDHIDIEGSANEFKHLLLNIISNAKDAFNEKKIEQREIVIRLIHNDHTKKMEIEDNAGGIAEDVLLDIFKANVSTKEESKGTGIGLYMSTQIAIKYHAVLSVSNKNAGACFTLEFMDSY